MIHTPAHNLWFAYVTLMLAFMVSAMPLPPALQWVWPEWVPLVCIYWVVALPHRFNIGLAFVLGLLMDLLQHNFLGTNALAMVCTVFFAALFYRRMRMYRPWQQSVVIFFLVAINQLVSYWGQSLGGNTTNVLLVMIPAITSAVIWPWIYVVLRGGRRVLQVS